MFHLRMYKKPFVVSLVFLALGIGLIISGFALAGGTRSMGYYAMVAFGVFALIIGIVVFVMYGRLEREFQRTVSDKPLLHFTVDKKLLQENISRNINEIKSQNKAILLAMLFFCAVTVIVLPFFFAEGYLFIFIGIGIAIFLSLSAWIITSYRIKKLRRGENEYILTMNGVYAGGEFHSWNMPGTSLTGVRFIKPNTNKQQFGCLEIEYTAASYPAPAQQKVNIPIPADLTNRVPEIIQILKQR